MAQFFDAATLSIYYTNWYFNFEKWYDVVDYYTDTTLSSIDIESGREQQITIKVMKSLGKIWRNFFLFWQYYVEDFLKVQNVNVYNSN